MLKRILIPLDDSKYSSNALEEACALAKYHDAEVTGIVVLDVPGIHSHTGPVPIGGSYFAKEMEKSLRERADKHVFELLDKFELFCRKEGVRYRRAPSQGMPSNKILQKSLFYDLLIMGMRTYFHWDADVNEEDGDSFEHILEHSITPIIAVPKNYSIERPYKKNMPLNALIAFDGSIESCRALQRFAQLTYSFTELEDNVHIVMSDDNVEKAEDYLDKVVQYLHAHGIENVTKHATDENIIKTIDEKYMNWAHYIVLGAHLKRGVFDFIAGSLTRYLIKEEKVPVFIGQ